MALTEVLVEPISAANAQVGEEIAVNLNISEGQNIIGYDLSLHFSPQVLEVVSVSEQPFLPQAGATNFEPGVIDNPGGQVTGIKGFLVDGARTGSGTLVTIRLRAKAKGSSELRLGEPKLYGPSRQLLGNVQGVSSIFSISNAPPSAQDDPSQTVVVKENPHTGPAPVPTETTVENKIGPGGVVAVGPQAWKTVFDAYIGGEKQGKFFTILGIAFALFFIFVAFRTRH